MSVFLIIAGWYILGIVGFIHNWTKQYDLRSDDVFVMFCAGFTGPLSFIIGPCIHSNGEERVVIIKRKHKEKL